MALRGEAGEFRRGVSGCGRRGGRRRRWHDAAVPSKAGRRTWRHGATIATRRGNKGPVAQGGWSAFSATHAGTDCINPAAYLGLRANGERAWFGWPDSPKVEAGIRAWFDAPDLEAEKAVARQLNRDALEEVVFVPTGFFLNKQAWRAELDGVVAGPLPVFWGVTKRG